MTDPLVRVVVVPADRYPPRRRGGLDHGPEATAAVLVTPVPVGAALDAVVDAVDVAPTSVSGTPAAPDPAVAQAELDRKITDAHDHSIRVQEREIAAARAADRPVELPRLGGITVDGRLYSAADVSKARRAVLRQLTRESERRKALPAQPNCIDDHEEVYFPDVD
jgi:hypothetical protein